jgi:4-aminobutyrate aminotransferase/(S)-3-amino-2-methylpropionate transaminase
VKSQAPFGAAPPHVRVPPPGPASRALAERLRRVEAPGVTCLAGELPIFWTEAAGCNVRDADGNVYVDLTAAFGVAALGHRHPRIVDAVRVQADRLVHGMGDVHPPEVKVRCLEAIAATVPVPDAQTVLATSGAEAVEIALKTAALAAGRPGVLCFTGAYHGLTYGALAVTDRAHFRAPFEPQLNPHVVRVPYPDPYRRPIEFPPDADPAAAALAAARHVLATERGRRVGAVLVEPILGRGGVVVPPDGFLRGLRELCDAHGLLLILDEILTGLGRTGRTLACEHEGVVPDLVCLGKALTGALPFAACVGRASAMAAWPPSTGEAIHTSTFLGHPLGCAAAIASLDLLREERLAERAARLGTRALDRLRTWTERDPRVGDVRGRGLLLGVEFVRDRERRTPDPDAAAAVARAALRRGVLVLRAGPYGNVLQLTPPLTIPEPLLDGALDLLEACLDETR